MSQHIKIAVIGSSGVGKSSLIRRFSRNEFRGTAKEICHRCKQNVSRATQGKHETDLAFEPKFQEYEISGGIPKNGNMKLYCDLLRKRCTCNRPQPEFKTVAYEGVDGFINITHVSILDAPAMTSFPEDTLKEFAVEGMRGVGAASAFILVFDVTKKETFEHIKQIRNDIKERYLRREETTELARSSALWKTGGHEEQNSHSSAKATKSFKNIRKTKRTNSKNRIFSILQDEPSTTSAVSDTTYQQSLPCEPAESVILVVGAKADLLENGQGEEGHCAWYRSAVYTIKKTWKHQYLPCSAKYGANVNAAFLAAVNSVLVARGRRKKTKGKGKRRT